jgi:hypothetical protein
VAIPKEVTDAFNIPVYLICGRDTKTGETWEAVLNGTNRWHHKERVAEAVEQLKRKQTSPHVVYEVKLEPSHEEA